MKEIKIPFNEWSKNRLDDLIKCATSRNKKYGEEGDYFIVDGTKYILTMIKKIPLWFIAHELYKTEGCKSPDEFKTVWKDIYPRKGWVDEQEVWYHYFVSTNYLEDL